MRTGTQFPVDSLALAHALDLYIEAMHRSQRGFYERPLVEDAALLEERLLGSTHPEYVSGLLHLADDRDEQNDDRGALDAARRALAIAEQTPAVSKELAPALTVMARLMREAGDTTQARTFYRRAIETREHEVPGDSLALGGLWAGLAATLADGGNATAARELYARAVAVCERLGPDRPQTIGIEDDFAQLLLAGDDYESARRHAERAAQSAERLPPAYGYAGWMSRRHYAQFLQAAGDFDRARAVYEDLLARAGESKYPTVGRELLNLGELAMEGGDPGHALCQAVDCTRCRL